MTEPRVLIVDNSPVIRKILSYVLEAEGCLVETAEDGLEALDCIARRRPDILFTDLIMPKIDGQKLSYIVRNTPELKDVFLVVLSGVALEDNDSALSLGADVCIAKGTAVTMKGHIRSALEKYRANQRGQATRIEGLEGLFPREVTSELLISKRHRDIILARMTEGVVELNHQGRIVMANSAALTLFALPEEQVLGQALARLLPEAGGGRITEWMQSVKSDLAAPPLLFSYDDPIRIGERQVTFNLVPVAEEGGFFVIGILQDVSRRKELERRQRQLERELQRIQKLDAMTMMASGIAHDFNNLLTIISGNIEMARYISQEDKVSQLLGESAKALGLTVQLIRQFTTFSDNYLPQKSRVCLHDLVDEILYPELAPTGISYRINTDDKELALTLDPNLVRQVFVNLTKNAVEAMAGKGRIEVTIDRVDGGEESIRTGQPTPGGELVRIAFHDSGPGISSRILDQVFDPYFSTKQKGAQKGMGLGLTIVHSIVKKHGGMIWIETPITGGCTFFVYFPLGNPTAADFGEPLPVAVRDRGRRVLVMDDDEMMRLINKKMFEHCGCDVTLAETGEEAVDLYRATLAAGRRFDLVLLDLIVRNGIGGLSAAKRICSLDPDAILVAVSGDGGSEVMLHYAEYNFVSALAKPFSIDAVEDIVQRFL